MEKQTTKHPRISAIAALDENRVIGSDGHLPWRIPEDSRRFRRLTLGHPIIMGRKTYESIGKPLDGRLNIIVTHSETYDVSGCVIAHSVDDALTYACKSDEEEIFLGGGESIYREGIDACDRLYLTLVKGAFKGSVKFPEYRQFNKVIEVSARTDGSYRYEFVVLEK